MQALLIIDVQNDFCPGGTLGVPRGDEVVVVANVAAALFSLRGYPVIATRDAHPEHHCSFASTYEGHAVGDVIDLGGTAQVLWPDHCVEGTSGAALHPGLRHDLIGFVQPKGSDPSIDSYSAFFDNARGHDTGLAKRLRAQGVDELWVMGLATDYCVKATALDARALGFSVTIISQGCRAVNVHPGDAEAALAEMAAVACAIVDEIPSL